MPIEVEVPDLGVVEFPDDMPEDQIQAALRKKVAPPTDVEQFSQQTDEPLEQWEPEPDFGQPLQALDIRDTTGTGRPPNFTSLESLEQAAQPHSSVLGIDPADIPSGANTTMPGLTIPLSSAAKLGAGIAGYLTSPQGILEIVGAMTPAAPAVYAKWAKDMIQGGIESIGEARNALNNVIGESMNELFARNGVQGSDDEEINAAKMEAVQTLTDNALNAAVMIPGGVKAGMHGLKASVTPANYRRGQPSPFGEPVPAFEQQEGKTFYEYLRQGSGQGQTPQAAPERGARVQSLVGGEAAGADPAWKQEGAAPAPKRTEVEALERKLADFQEMLEEAELPADKAVLQKKINEVNKALEAAGQKAEAPSLGLGLSESELQMIQAERAALDTPIEIVADIVESADGKDPFATNKKWRKGQFMRPNREKRTIEVEPAEFSKWLQAIPDEYKARAVKARLWEERFHMDVSDSAATTYWNNLTGIERAIEEYSYTGRWGKDARSFSQYGENPALWGQEAMRRRMQQLAHMDVSEIVEAAGVEKWTLKGLSIVETTVRGIRETLKGREGTAEAQAILDQIQANITGARAILSGQASSSDPGALRKDKRNKYQIAIDELRAAQAAEGRAKQPPVNRQEQAGARENLTDAWIKYFEARMENGPEEPGALNKKQPDLFNVEASESPDVISRKEISAQRGSALPALDPRRKSSDYDYYVSRLADKELLQWSVPMGEIESGLLAVPVGGSRKSGTLGCATMLDFASAQAAAQKLSGVKGFPRARVIEIPRPDLATNPERFNVEWGDEVDWSSGWKTDMAAYHRRLGRQFGYRAEDPGALNKFGGEEPKRNKTMTDEEWKAYLDKLPRQSEEARLQRMREQLGKGRAKTQAFDPDQGKLFGEASARGVPGQENVPRGTAEEAGALPKLSIDQGAKEYLSGEIKPSGKGEEVTYNRPNFRDFSEWVQNNVYGYATAHEGQLRSLWQDSVWKELMNASPERLSEWRRAFGLDKSHKEGGLGDRPISTPIVEKPVFQLEGEVLGGKTARRQEVQQRRETAKLSSDQRKYRNRLISTIAVRLAQESAPRARELERSEMTIDDVDFSNTKTVEGAYREIREVEAKDPKALERIFKDQARVSNRDPVSTTRRLVVLVSRKTIKDRKGRPTSKVEVVSTYKGPEEAMLTDPDFGAGKERPAARLSSILRRYRPIASILIKDPVRNFHQSFETVRDFMDAVGEEAAKAERVREYSGLAGESTDAAAERPAGVFKEGAPPPEGTGPEFFEDTPGTSVMRGEGAAAGAGPAGKEMQGLMGIGRGTLEASRNQPLTASEASAVREYVLDEVGKVESTQDMRLALDGLAERAKERGLRGIHRQVISALQKAADAIGRESSELTPDQKWEAALDEFYAYIKDSKTPEEFIQGALGRFTKETEAAGGEGIVVPGAPRQAGGVSRELTMRDRVPPTTVRESQLPPGTPPIERRPAPETPIGRPGPSQPQRMLSPEAAAAVAERSRQEHPFTRRTPIKTPEGIQVYREEPGALNKYAKAGGRKASEIVTDVIRAPLAAYSGWMVDRLRDHGGPTTQIAADAFNEIIDRRKQLYGSLTPVLDPARKAAGKPGKGTRWLHGLKKVTPFAATARSVLALENKIRVPAFAQNIVTLSQTANLAIGRMYQPVARRFQASGLFQRNFNARGYDVIRQGSGKLWERWTAATARINKKPLADTRTFFHKLKAILDEANPDFNRIESINQEFKRQFPEVVTHLHDGYKWEPIMHTDLFGYLEAAAQQAAHARAFREKFPNTAAGRQMFSQLEKAVSTELSAQGKDIYDSILRTLQGHPTDSYSTGIFSNVDFMAPGRTIPELGRIINQTLGNVFGKMVLTGQMIMQPAETMVGSTPSRLGEANTTRAWSRMAAQKGQLYAELEKNGAVNRVIYDWSFDPHSPVRSSARIAGNVLSKVFMEHFLNEMQELGAATTAKVVSERIQANTLTPWERRMLPQTFREMGFTRDQVLGLMAGDAGLLGQFERKAAAFLSTGNKSITEGSKIGANRMFNTFFRFQSYPMMKTNQLRKVLRGVSEAWEGGSRTEKRASVESLARFMFYTTLQGALTTAIAAVFYKGFLGAKIKSNEAADEPIQFLTESFLAAMGGPLYLVWRSARSKGVGGVGEQAGRLIFPYAMIRELTDMAGGDGRYRDKDLSQKIGEYVSRTMPGTRAIKTGLSFFGLSQDDHKLDAAMDGYYRWRMDELGGEKFESNLQKDDRRKFRMAMKGAVEAMKQGDKQEFQKQINAATGAARNQEPRWVAQSLRMKQVLKGPGNRELTPGEFKKLRERIGDEAVGRLQYYNAMLEAAADGVMDEDIAASEALLPKRK